MMKAEQMVIETLFEVVSQLASTPTTSRSHEPVSHDLIVQARDAVNTYKAYKGGTFADEEDLPTLAITDEETKPVGRVQVVCPMCDGRRHLWNNRTCRQCGGSGMVWVLAKGNQ